MKKKVRNIEVDGKNYVWTAKRGYRDLTLRIWDDKKTIVFEKVYPNVLDYEYQAKKITPGYVAEIIKTQTVELV